MTKVEADIVSMMKESLNLQSESFEIKYNKFKELLTALNIKRERDQVEMFE
jgi:hypothetical protein